jgi:hypothetical protein
MHALKDSIAPRQREQVADPMDPPATNLVSIWARGRRRITPWAFPRLRALGATRLTIGVFLVAVGALLLSHGHGGWAAIPLAGAALNLSIGGLDMAVAHSAHPRS